MERYEQTALIGIVLGVAFSIFVYCLVASAAIDEGEILILNNRFVRVDAEPKLPAGVSQRAALCFNEKMDYSNFSYACIDKSGKEYPIICDCAAGCRISGITKEGRRC